MSFRIFLVAILCVSLLVGCARSVGPAPPLGGAGAPATAPSPAGFDFEVTVANWSTRDATVLIETPVSATPCVIPAGGAILVDVPPAPAWVRVSAAGFATIEVVAGRDYAFTSAGVGVALQ